MAAGGGEEGESSGEESFRNGEPGGPVDEVYEKGRHTGPGGEDEDRGQVGREEGGEGGERSLEERAAEQWWRAAEAEMRSVTRVMRTAGSGCWPCPGDADAERRSSR